MSSQSGPTASAALPPNDGAWWRQAVVYQLYVRSFADANGDGIGDLDGITAHLDDLAWLGVDAIWLNPCYPSPQADHGYDVADYTDIEPDYGTLATFDALVAAAAARGIKVVMDTVPNHCSIAHPWFQAALAAAPGSPQRARFYFADGRGDGSEPPNNWPAWFGGPAWTRVVEADGQPGQWYLHLFTPQQPDLNWTNPEVVALFDDALAFWFDRGVEGFRVDAAITLGKAPGLPDVPAELLADRPALAANANVQTLHREEGHAVFRHWRQTVDRYQAAHPGRELFLVGEAFSPNPDVFAKYLRPDELHSAFYFDLLLAPWHAPSMRAIIDEALAFAARTGAPLTWTLNNHDTQRSVTRYGRADATDPAAQSGNNLVASVAPVDVELGLRRARAALLLLLALPGSAYLYQGEELGLPEVLDLPAAARQDPLYVRTGGRELGRDGCRVPLPWTADPATSFGFSAAPAGGPTPAGAPAPPWLPQPASWGGWAADRQRDDATSTLRLYRDALAIRRQLTAGDHREPPFDWLAHPDADVLVASRGELVLALNLGAAAAPLDLPDPAGGGEWQVAVSSLAGHTDPRQLPADSALWLLAR